MLLSLGERVELGEGERPPALVDQIIESDVAVLAELPLAWPEDPRCKPSESHVVRRKSHLLIMMIKSGPKSRLPDRYHSCHRPAGTILKQSSLREELCVSRVASQPAKRKAACGSFQQLNK